MPWQQRRMRAVILFFVGVFLGGAVAGAAGYVRWNKPHDPYAKWRFAHEKRAEDFPTGGALLIGDSIVHRLYIPELCGKPVFNAGMAGARADQIAPLSAVLIDKLRPSIIVVSAGANDREQGDAWHRDLEKIAPRGAIVIDAPTSLAVRNGWAVIPALPAILRTDDVHANAAGRSELKKRIADTACS
ncbi:hypothetical protein EAO27_13440 [Sphingopyxis sp. YF1]|nr:hypothetical protein EAO27_13440 [Sphingopyxis sp. YF1]